MRLGIDIGGTNIKFGVVDNEYKILEKYIIPTVVNKGDEQIISDMQPYKDYNFCQSSWFWRMLSVA